MSFNFLRFLRGKLFLTALLVILAVMCLYIYGVRNLRQIADQAHESYSVAAFMRDTLFEAQEALHEGLLVMAKAMNVNIEPKDYYELRQYEGRFLQTMLKFDMNIQAMILGSQSEEFKKLNAGLTYTLWQRHTQINQRVVKPASPQIAVQLKQINKRYEDFSRLVLLSIKFRRQSLLAQLLNDSPKSQQLEQESSHQWFAAEEISEELVDMVDKVTEGIKREVGVYVQDAADQQRKAFETLALIILILIIFLKLSQVIVIERILINPIDQINRKIKLIGTGDLSARLDYKKYSYELQQLSRSFNDMVDHLNEVMASRDELNQEIEKRKKTEQQLALKNKDFETNARVLKTMVADLQLAHKNLKQTQEQLLQSEKLASIGQLAAGIAHEINNPMGYISNNIQALGKYAESIKRYFQKVQKIKDVLSKSSESEATRLLGELESFEEEIHLQRILKDIEDLLKESMSGVERIKHIVEDLRKFSRKDIDEASLIDVREVLDEVINIIGNELKYKCELIKDIKPVPYVKANTLKMGQVFMNLLLNANYSIKNKGKIFIRVRQENQLVCVDIEDTGQGIAEKDVSRIFDPFFTTKRVGEGTGLGLSISYDIVKSYGGEIQVKSKINQGTTFTVMLPAKEKKKQ